MFDYVLHTSRVATTLTAGIIATTITVDEGLL